MIAVSHELLHRWLDELAPEDVPLVARVLEGLRYVPRDLPAVLREAPTDEEPDDDDANGGLTEARSEMWRGEGIPLEQTRRELRI